MIVTFTFSRRIGYYLINFYVPCIIMVIMSWIVFWMDRDCIGDRIALGITTVLTIVFLLGSSNSTMPRVSYPKAIDWYLMTSFIFVFTTLIMCLLIFRFDRQLGKQQRPPRSVSGEPPAEATSMQVLLELFRSKCCHNEITRLSGGGGWGGKESFLPHPFPLLRIFLHHSQFRSLAFGNDHLLRRLMQAPGSPILGIRYSWEEMRNLSPRIQVAKPCLRGYPIFVPVFPPA